MRLRGIALGLMASYCLLSTVCIGLIILIRGGYLGEQTQNCRDNALRAMPVIMDGSVRVYEDEDDDQPDSGTVIYGYTVDASIADVIEFYDPDGSTCDLLDEGQAARCLVSGSETAHSVVEIKTGETQTLYQIIVNWHCSSDN